MSLFWYVMSDVSEMNQHIIFTLYWSLWGNSCYIQAQRPKTLPHVVGKKRTTKTVVRIHSRPHVKSLQVSFYTDSPVLSSAGSGVSPSLRWQLNWSLKASSRWGTVSSTLTSLPSSALSDVTPFPSTPHGTMWPNHDRSVLQFRAKPWEVTYRPQWIPMKGSYRQWITDVNADSFTFHKAVVCTAGF